MKRSRFSEEQIIGILKEHQAGLAIALSVVLLAVLVGMIVLVRKG